MFYIFSIVVIVGLIFGVKYYMQYKEDKELKDQQKKTEKRKRTMNVIKTILGLFGRK